jgi:ELWxxDGT repeat protein
MLLFFALASSAAAEQAVTLARDIQPNFGPYLGPVSSLVTVGDVVYFQGPAYSGTTIWRSDGTPGGTRRLKNVDPRGFSYNVESLTNVGGRLFFAASGPEGQELWSSDGTEAGTARVTDLCPGTCSGLSESTFRRTLAAVGDVVFFAGRDGTTATPLWKSDGTAAGTVPVGPVEPNGFSSPRSLTRFGERLLFTADDPAHGRELWLSDGTTAGTALVADARPGPADGVGASPRITAAGARAFFVANDGVHGSEPWIVEGTSARMVADVRPGPAGSAPRAMVALGGVLVFQAQLASGAVLWRTDGTPAGTFPLADLGYGDEPFTTSLAVVGGHALFTAADAAHGAELWRTDGTVAGTAIVTDIAPGTESSSPAQLTHLGGRVYFTANDGPTGQELWVTDGTAAGTAPVTDVLPGAGQSSPEGLTAGTHLLYFFAGTDTGERLFRSDGTAAGTFALPVSTNADGSNPEGFVDFGGQAFFVAAEDGRYGLWRSDGSEPGTQQVKDFGSTQDVYLYLVHAGRLLFTVNDLAHGTELWASDGTEAGTQLVVDLAPGSTGSQPHGLTPFAGSVYFGAWGFGLYKTDGTAAGTQLVSTVNAGELAVHQGMLYFSTATGLWKSDGTTAGTVLVKEIDPFYAGVRELVSVGPLLFFVAGHGIDDGELWASDGTEGGTRMVKDIQPGGGSPFGSTSPAFTDWNGVLYFVVHSGVTGATLWRSDGTDAGTVPVQFLGPPSGAVPSMVVANGRLFYFATDPEHGIELWRRDGAGDASMVVDLWPGAGSSEPRGLLEADGAVFFSAHSPAAGWELFRSDGTAAGTSAVDIEPGSASSVSWSYTHVGDRLFMSATDLAHGREPWSLKLGRSVSIADAAVTETNGTTVAQLAVSLSSAAPTPVTVTFATGGGSASPDTDYTPAAGSVTFAPGATTATVAVAVQGDALDEDTETFGVQIASTDVLVADGTGEARILDDDARPALSVADCVSAEGNAGAPECLFSFQLSAASGRTVSAGFATDGVTAASPGDFVAASGTVVFEPGQTVKGVAVAVVGDVLHEGDETFRFDLDAAQNATTTDGSAVGLILDDDGASSARGELAHGASASLPLGTAGADLFRIDQAPFSSYEVVLDGLSGDGVPLVLRRLAPNGVTVLQSSQPVGTGAAASLSWENTDGVVSADQLVGAAGLCAPACAAGTAYRIRAYDTTYTVPRFNNTAGQTTVVFVHNPDPRAVAGHVRFWDGNGVPLATAALTLPPRGSLVLNTSGLPELAGLSGSISVTSDARYGALTGKAVTLDAVTGTSYEAPLLPRVR